MNTKTVNATADSAASGRQERGALYIGIDLGTSSVKLLLVAADGTIRSEAAADYPVSRPHDGWSEQNPADWVEGVFAGLEALLRGADRQAVRGIAVAGQMHGLVAMDAAGQVIRPAILWNDGRTVRRDGVLERNGRTGYARPLYGQHRLCRVHRAQTAVDAPARAGRVLPHRENSAAQGLCRLRAHRPVLHRRFRRVGHAAAGCEKPPLVGGNVPYMRRGR